MTEPSIHVLLVEDNPTDVLLLREALAEVRLVPFELTEVAQLADVQPRLSQARVDVILLDLGLPDSQGLDTLVKLRQQSPQIPIVVLTGLADEELGLKALQAGAQDYLVKGQVEGSGLARAIRYAIERKRAEAALREGAEHFRATFDQALVGMSHIAPDGRWLRVNQKMCDIVGYNPAELLQRTFMDITYVHDKKFKENRKSSSLS